jgi:hypothetical protein
MFMAQVAATTFSCFIQVAVLNFAFSNIKDVCTPHQEQHFTCPGGRVFFSGMFPAPPPSVISNVILIFSQHL